MDHLSIVIGKAGIDDKDNRHSFIRRCIRPVCNAFLPSITLSNSTPIAKPLCTGNPVKRIMAFNKVADISEIEENSGWARSFK
jgi:hypothetical protein